MSGRLNQQHMQYALRTEMELNRVQSTQELNRYYDHWGKVTSRFENWTNKEYYDNAGKKLQSKKDMEQKERSLIIRRNKLRQMFCSENECYQKEMEKKKQPKKPTDNVDTLSRVNQSLKDREQLKRKLELEAKLYGRWRHGVDDENLLYQCKSNNQVLAKLNWLDKQIENTQQRRQEEALAVERQLELQQEINKTEEAQKERQLMREKEIKELRELLEMHVAELKRRQQRSEKLKEEERHLRTFLEELKKELQLLEQSATLVLQRPDLSNAFNLRKIKVLIRSRSEAYCKQIELCINILERILCYATKTESLRELLNKYQEQKDNESLVFAQIEGMYESEAKYSLERCEENWRELHLQRFADIKKLIEMEERNLSSMLAENMLQQEELLELRSTHLAAIENSSRQMERLNQESKALAYDQQNTIDESLASPASSKIMDSSIELPKVSNSFSNLNLDRWQDFDSTTDTVDSARLNKTRSMNVVTQNNAAPPKFARKRVAWT